MRTNKAMLLGMQNEQKILDITLDLYGIPTEQFNYIVYDSKECRENITPNLAANIIYSSKGQLAGNDITYKGLSFDIKVNGQRYDRACFELYKENDGTFSYRKPKDTGSIITVMKSTGFIFTFPCSFIENIVNRVNINNLNLPHNFYSNQNIFFENLDSYIGKKEGKENKKLFLVDPSALINPLRNYLAYQNTNQDLTFFYFNAKPYKTDCEFEEI